jgi:membrane protease YdiL (CAAX protease family)
MKKILFACVFLLALTSNAQSKITKNDLYDHWKVVSALQDSKDIKYQDYLALYNQQIALKPNDVQLKVERCNYIGSAYDTEDGYNSKYEEYNQCVDQLYRNYPENLKVIHLKAESSYGDSLTVILEKAEKILWSKSGLEDDDVYKILLLQTRNLKNEGQDFLAKKKYEKALQYNDSIDNSILGAELYINLNNQEKAKEELLRKIDADTTLWRLNRKAKLLLDLQAYDKAFEIYQGIQKRDSSYLDNEDLSKALVSFGKIEEARGYLLRDTIYEWNLADNNRALLKFDFEHSDGPIILKSYRKVDAMSYNNDFFGVKRIKLFFKSPWQPWNLREISHILVLILSIFILFLIPYIWVLPIKYLGDYFKLKPKVKHFPFKWTLKDFWWISFVFLAADVISSLIFNYQGFLNFILETAFEDDLALSNYSMMFMLLMAFGTALLIKKKNLRYLSVSKLPLLRAISFFFFFLFVDYLILRFLNFSSDLESETYTILTVREDIQAVITDFGLLPSILMLAVIVPIYEEVIFRGIMLTSITNHLGFWKANLIQATIFSLVHFNLGLFFYYFFFGFFIGLVTRKSQGLRTGIIFHAINNFIATLAIYALMGSELNWQG